MKLLFQVLLALAVAAVVQGIGIRTQVWVKRTGADGADPGPNNELIVTVREFGNGQNQMSTANVNVPSNIIFQGAGQKLLDSTFTGNQLPRSIEARIVEDDGPAQSDDGVCFIRITTKFTKAPISVICTRESKDGLQEKNIYQVRVQVV